MNAALHIVCKKVMTHTTVITLTAYTQQLPAVREGTVKNISHCIKEAVIFIVTANATEMWLLTIRNT